MTHETQKQKAAEFLALHSAPQLLVLPNVWDTSSAKVFELEGFQAIGTTSAGISATLGYPDGQRMSLDENMEVVRRIAKDTDLPVSADIEAGYAGDTQGVVQSARSVLATGAVGLNLEDSTGNAEHPLFEQEVMLERIAAIREMADAEGIHLVINARTDVFLVSREDRARKLKHAVQRANAYRAAGADCIFVPDMGDLDRETMASLVAEIDAPLNIIAGATTPAISELQQIGVARVSLGPRHMRAALTLLRKIARELLDSGTFQLLNDSTITYSEVNSWFKH